MGGAKWSCDRTLRGGGDVSTSAYSLLSLASKSSVDSDIFFKLTLLLSALFDRRTDAGLLLMGGVWGVARGETGVARGTGGGVYSVP